MGTLADHINPTRRTRRRWTKSLAGGLAAAVLAGSVAPSLAAQDRQHATGSSFSHHFHRNQQLHATHRHAANLGYSAAHFGYDAAADAVAMTAEAMPLDEAVAYCSSRFRSYDPSTGTYLGYDGEEHACP